MAVGQNSEYCSPLFDLQDDVGKCGIYDIDFVINKGQTQIMKKTKLGSIFRVTKRKPLSNYEWKPPFYYPSGLFMNLQLLWWKVGAEYLGMFCGSVIPGAYLALDWKNGRQ
jgi:hypothetical protein